METGNPQSKKRTSFFPVKCELADKLKNDRSRQRIKSVSFLSFPEVELKYPPLLVDGCQQDGCFKHNQNPKAHCWYLPWVEQYVFPKVLQNKFWGKPVSNLDTHRSPITLTKTNKDTQQQMPNISTSSLVCPGLCNSPNPDEGQIASFYIIQK